MFLAEPTLARSCTSWAPAATASANRPAVRLAEIELDRNRSAAFNRNLLFGETLTSSQPNERFDSMSAKGGGQGAHGLEPLMTTVRAYGAIAAR